MPHVAWKLLFGKVCDLDRQTVRKSKDDGQRSSHYQPFACVRRAQSDFMVGIHCKKYQ